MYYSTCTHVILHNITCNITYYSMLLYLVILFIYSMLLVARALAIMYFISIFSISIDTIALRNICYAMMAIVINHMCALSYQFILVHRLELF